MHWSSVWLLQPTRSRAGKQRGHLGKATGLALSLGVSLVSWHLLLQDPDLEAKRKAELAKIRKKNKQCREKVQQALQKQKELQLKRRLQKKMERQNKLRAKEEK